MSSSVDQLSWRSDALGVQVGIICVVGLIIEFAP